MIWAEENAEPDFRSGGLTVECGEYLSSLARRAARPGMTGFEIGIYTGWTACRVLPTFKENAGILHCLDWFKGSFETTVANHEMGPNFPSAATLMAALANFELMGFADNVTLCVASSRAMAPIIKEGSLDYVYIGADHRYSEIKADIGSWLPKLRRGGIICGHAFDRKIEPESDFWNRLLEEKECDYIEGVHFGVIKAVTEMLPNFETNDQIWASVVE